MNTHIYPPLKQLITFCHIYFSSIHPKQAWHFLSKYFSMFIPTASNIESLIKIP